jgi:chromosome segregation ATPase
MDEVGRDFTEVLVAIGRIEEGIKSLRQSIDRLERKSDAQDGELRLVKDEVQDLQLDVQQLKTQRSTVKENLAVVVSVAAFLAAMVSVVNALAS